MSDHANKERDAGFMRRALELARSARPSPNPRVGAVVVKGDEIIGEGFHARVGSPHAEVLALEAAAAEARGADLYITLEPCCHFGRTGPCTEAIHRAGPGRVIIGMIDPDQRVNGRGAAHLATLGYEVTIGVCEEECREMLGGYLVHRALGRPQFILKAAVTLDGSIATSRGESKWISGEAARRHAHAARARSDVVMVGVETVIADDPMLDVRLVEGPNPVRLVLDTRLRILPTARLLRSPDVAPVVIAHAANAPRERMEPLGSLENVTLLECALGSDGRLDLRDLARRLGEMGVTQVLAEGGALVHGSLVCAGLADRFALYVSGRLLGMGKRWISLPQTSSLSLATGARIERVMQLDADVLLEGAIDCAAQRAPD